MAAKTYEIKTSLALDGEKEFNAALNDANRSMRVMDSELKKLQAAYEAGGSEMDYYTGRSEALEREFKQQQAIVEALARAVDEAAEAYGEASSEVQGYQIRLNNAEAKLSKLAKASQDANRDLEELGRDSGKIGRQVENGIGDAAEDTARKVDDMFESLSEDIAAIRSNTTFEFFSNVSSSILGAANSLDSFAESSRDYRRSMSFLESNARTYGLDFANVKKLFLEMSSVTGDVDSSVEALSNLMAAGFDAEELVSAVNLLGGAVVSFPDTLKFESLADGLQETLATGQATGQYAELLGRLGVNIDDFNTKLGEAETAEEKQQIALAYLTENGLATTYKGYKEINKELLAAEEASLRLNDAWAALGGIVDTYIAPAKAKMAGFLEELTEFAQNMIVEPNQEWYMNQLAQKYPAFAEALKSGKLGSIGGALDVTKNALENVDVSGSEFDFEEYVKNKLSPEVYAELEAEYQAAAERKKAEKERAIYDEFMSLISPAGASELETAYEDEGAMAWTFYADGWKEAAEQDTALGEALRAAMSSMDEEADAAMTAGTNAMTSFANGIAAGSVSVLNNVDTLVDQINQKLASIAMPAFGYGFSGITGGSIYLSSEQMTDTVSRGMAQRVRDKLYLK